MGTMNEALSVRVEDVLPRDEIEGSKDSEESAFMPFPSVTYTPGALDDAKTSWMFPASVEYEAPGVYVGQILGLPGCVTQGATAPETVRLLKSALLDVLRVHREHGTEPVFEKPEQCSPSSIVNICVEDVDVQAA